jgi:hypothetical protein
MCWYSVSSVVCVCFVQRGRFSAYCKSSGSCTAELAHLPGLALWGGARRSQTPPTSVGSKGEELEDEFWEITSPKLPAQQVCGQLPSRPGMPGCLPVAVGCAAVSGNYMDVKNGVDGPDVQAFAHRVTLCTLGTMGYKSLDYDTRLILPPCPCPRADEVDLRPSQHR